MLAAEFVRSPNGDGNLQWRCVSIAEIRVPHTTVLRAKGLTSVTCNIKRAPKVGAYSKPPAYYM